MKRIALTLAGLLVAGVSIAQTFEFRQPIKGLSPSATNALPDNQKPLSLEGLVYHYPLYENLSGTGSNATSLGYFSGSLEFSSESPVPGAGSAYFNGNTGLNAGGQISGTGDFTYGAWIKAEGNTASYVIGQRGSDNNGQFNLIYVPSDGRFSFWDWPGGTGVTSLPTPNGSAPISQWIHVTVARGADLTTRIFVDGTEVASRTMSTLNNVRPSVRFYLGYDGRDRNDFFRGNIMDVYGFNRLLDEKEIAWLAAGNRFPTDE